MLLLHVLKLVTCSIFPVKEGHSDFLPPVLSPSLQGSESVHQPRSALSACDGPEEPGK